MMSPEVVRQAKRWGVVLGAVTALGGVTYAAASAVAKSDEAARRLAVVETAKERLRDDVSRIEGKLDAVLTFFRIPYQERRP